MSQTNKQPWIESASFDSVWILSPAFLSLIVVMLLPGSLRQGAEMPLAAWVVLILLIDVAHVYSTLFRTYLDPVRRVRYRHLLTAVPLICYVSGVLVYSVNGLIFWRLLAYLAVFHFVRQQYGFLRLYSRVEPAGLIIRRIDAVTIYSATLYPVLWWHLHPGRNFNWFVEHDFIYLSADWLLPFADFAYFSILSIYLVKEMVLTLKGRRFNIPKNAIVCGTAISWYAGIVVFNGDLPFTILNVVAHGIPYIALIWATSKKENEKPGKRGIARVFFGQYGIFLFAASLFLLSWFEEGLWDGLIWHEHSSVFLFFSSLPSVTDAQLLVFFVPLLSLPQAVHYVLDGFIWRRGN